MHKNLLIEMQILVREGIKVHEKSTEFLGSGKILYQMESSGEGGSSDLILHKPHIKKQSSNA